MDRHCLWRACAALLAAGILLGGCSQPPAPGGDTPEQPPPPSSPAGTPTPAPFQTPPPTTAPTQPPPIDYVAIGGDFTYGQAWDELYAGYLQQDLGAPVRFADLSTHSALTLKRWLEQLQAEGDLRQALQGAEVVTFDVPLEAYLSMPSALYQNNQCGGEDGLQCYRDRQEQLRQELPPFIEELRSLTSSNQALLRTFDIGTYDAFIQVGDGSLDNRTDEQRRVLAEQLRVFNQIVREIAADHGVPVVDISPRVQPDGLDSPPRPEYMLMLGLSEAGERVVADMLRAQGYDPAPDAALTFDEDGCDLKVFADPIPDRLRVQIDNPTGEDNALVVVTLVEGAGAGDLLAHSGPGTPPQVEAVVSHLDPGPGGSLRGEVSLAEGRENYFVCARPDQVLAVPGALAPGQAYQPPPAVRVVRDIPYVRPAAEGARQFTLDVYAPEPPGDYPVAVFLHGSNNDNRAANYQELFKSLAGQGAVVFAPNSFAGSGGELARAGQGAGIRHDLENTACALRYARATARQYGGDPGRVVLIGHSGGGYNGLWITLNGDQLDQTWDSQPAGPPRQVECAAGQELSPLPDAFIGFNGGFVVFDQHRTEFPELFRVLDPRSYAGRHPEVPLLLVFGDQDFSYVHLPWFRKGVDELVALLQEAGNDVRFELWPGIGHFVDSRSALLLPDQFRQVVDRLPSSAP